MIKHIFLAIALVILSAPSLYAVTPDEVMDDPALEQRARQISSQLRCVVCRGENIDESNAGIARQLRLLVRERLSAGDSDDKVVGYVVERFGEYVLMKPNKQGVNLVLWGSAPFFALLAMIGVAGYLRQRANASDKNDALSEDEQARLDEILERD